MWLADRFAMAGLVSPLSPAYERNPNNGLGGMIRTRAGICRSTDPANGLTCAASVTHGLSGIARIFQRTQRRCVG